MFRNKREKMFNFFKKNKYRMPGEWEKHSATWLAWPNDDDYFEDRIKNVENIYLEIVKHLHKDELVKLLVLNKEKEELVKKQLIEAEIDISKIIFYYADYFDVWMRDYGPMFVKDGSEKKWIKWQYDGYGGKFQELLPDNKVFSDLKDVIKHDMIVENTVLEGGAIDPNGSGTILTTEECLLENRNKGLSKDDYQIIFEKALGVKNIIWLKKGLLNDHTDGHIDEIARFVGPNKIICAYEDDVNNENYGRLNENYEILKNAIDQDGNKFEVIKLPMPHMHYDEGEKEHSGVQAPVSYTNFYIGNKTVLVSIFHDENDEKALDIIKSCFPERNAVGIDCRDLIYGGGAIHCITQQEPI